MMREAGAVGPDMEWRPRRTPVEDLLAPAEQRGGGGPTPAQIARFRARAELQRQIQAMVESEGIAGMLSRSSRKYGIIRGGGNATGREATGPDPLPIIVIGEEQYGQLYRNVMEGLPVEVEINVQNRFYKDDLQAYNTFAEIPGTDKADEYVMIGAHLDSWHWGTGATDNGAGSLVMMEAMRILETLNLHPRRTIRIGLWSGEEQGLLGSRNWLEKHPEIYPRISAYLNVDNGTGKIRGIWDQSNTPAGPIFEQILFPFRDLGVVAVRHGNTGGTDHLSFVRNGIPGFNFIQDPIEYGIRTHHTNVDAYDQLMLDDLQQAAVIVAATAYELAMREEMMPRPEPAQP